MIKWLKLYREDTGLAHWYGTADDVREKLHSLKKPDLLWKISNVSRDSYYCSGVCTFPANHLLIEILNDKNIIGFVNNISANSFELFSNVVTPTINEYIKTKKYQLQNSPNLETVFGYKNMVVHQVVRVLHEMKGGKIEDL